jgi:hypothetical protein
MNLIYGGYHCPQAKSQSKDRLKSNARRITEGALAAPVSQPTAERFIRTTLQVNGSALLIQHQIGWCSAQVVLAIFGGYARIVHLNRNIVSVELCPVTALLAERDRVG